MAKSNQSAGLLPYRWKEGRLEVFLVHPGGPFWKKKDDGAWSIAKGKMEEGEGDFQAAEREFREETGFEVKGVFLQLSPVRQAGGKTVHAWAVAAELDPALLKSSTFSMEFPPKSGRQAEFPEIDRAAWFGMAEARKKLLNGQLPFLDQLERQLRKEPPRTMDLPFA